MVKFIAGQVAIRELLPHRCTVIFLTFAGKIEQRGDTR